MQMETQTNDGISTKPGSPDVSTRIVQAIATELDVDELDLPPLYSVVDTDALDALVGSTSRGDAGLSIEFGYSGCLVTVHGDGAIDVEDAPQLKLDGDLLGER